MQCFVKANNMLSKDTKFLAFCNSVLKELML